MAGEPVGLELEPMEAVTRSAVADAQGAPLTHDEGKRNLVVDWDFEGEQPEEVSVDAGVGPADMPFAPVKIWSALREATAA
jgi:hypothetical protein